MASRPPVVARALLLLVVLFLFGLSLGLGRAVPLCCPFVDW